MISLIHPKLNMQNSQLLENEIKEDIDLEEYHELIQLYSDHDEAP